MKRYLSVLLMLTTFSLGATEPKKDSALHVDFDEVSVQTVKPGSVTDALNVTEVEATKNDLSNKKTDYQSANRNDAQTVGEGL